jgi:hypothetical protein
VQFDHYGPADILRVVDVPRPSAGDGQVLVRVAATAINPGEIAVSPTFGEIKIFIGTDRGFIFRSALSEGRGSQAVEEEGLQPPGCLVRAPVDRQLLGQQRGQDDDVARGDVRADRAVAPAAVEDALERLVDGGPGGESFRVHRDGAAVQREDELVGVADDTVQERAQRGEAGLIEVLGVLRALKTPQGLSRQIG